MYRVIYATHRLRVRWDERALQLSDILKAVTKIGYLAHPTIPAAASCCSNRGSASACYAASGLPAS